MSSRTYRLEYRRQCGHCKSDFTTWNKSARYCTKRCRSLAAAQRRERTGEGEWLRIALACKNCGTEFYRTKQTGPNKKYCSPECSGVARLSDFQRWKAENPGSMVSYNQHRVAKYGRDTVINRLRKRYPDLPTECEAFGCTEGRVLEIAHKPGFERRGAWRTMDVMERHMFWLLCPTHHRILDFGIETADELGLAA